MGEQPDLVPPAGLGQLTGDLAELFRVLPGPVASLSLRAGDYAIEVTWAAAAGPASSPPAAAGLLPTSATAAQPGDAASGDPGLLDVAAPLVGTFYAAPEPGAAPFARPGDHVKQGQTVGIVEAMKLMNPVESPRDGLVTEVLVADGEPVEFGQPLVRLRTDQS
jgi:acetyl-CoA carboxylase biotin carboxyl carrier protein